MTWKIHEDDISELESLKGRLLYSTGTLIRTERSIFKYLNQYEYKDFLTEFHITLYSDSGEKVRLEIELNRKVAYKHKARELTVFTHSFYPRIILNLKDWSVDGSEELFGFLSKLAKEQKNSLFSIE